MNNYSGNVQLFRRCEKLNAVKVFFSLLLKKWEGHDRISPSRKRRTEPLHPGHPGNRPLSSQIAGNQRVLPV